MSMNTRLYAMPSHLGACALALSGAFPPYTTTLAYTGEIDIADGIGDVKVVSVLGTLPPGAVVEVVASKLRISWPAYAVLASHTIDVPNKDFESGDTGWVKGPGIAIDTLGDKLAGSYSATFKAGVGGISPIVSDTLIPVTAGKSITAQFQFQQGASSAGNMLGVTILEWFDGTKQKVRANAGNVIDSGSGGAWHPSSVTAAAPVDGYVRPGFNFNRRRQNKKAYIDSFSWNGAVTVLDDVEGTNGTGIYPIVIVVRDEKGCESVFEGIIQSSGQPAQLSDWRYKQIGRTDATDYSSPSYDDSAWTIGDAPFGSFEDHSADHFDPVHDYDPAFSPKFATNWTTNTRLWMRRTLTLSGSVPAGGFRLVGYIEDHAAVYVNGVLVASTVEDPPGGAGFTVDIAADKFVVGDNSIAVRCDDEAPTAGNSLVYADFYLIGI